MVWVGECGRERVVGKIKNEGSESTSLFRDHPHSTSTDHRGRRPSATGTASRSRINEKPSSSLSKEHLLDLHSTQNARRVPPTSARLQRRLCEAFADCRVPEAPV